MKEVIITPKQIAKAISNLLNENERLSKWWQQTNVIIKNEKSLMINDEAMLYIDNLEQKINKAIDYINTSIKPLDTKILNNNEIDTLFEILEK